MTASPSTPHDASRAPEPTPQQIRRWRKALAEERAEARIYRDLARRASGTERAVLTELADAERRHEAHWERLLGEHAGPTRMPVRVAVLGFLARIFGFVFVLALVQRSEERSTYGVDADATDQMAADERIHSEVIRGLAERGRAAMSGSFRAAVFGANDGLVSNLALVLGIGAASVADGTVLFTGIAGLFAGALSMAAGEYVSVKSQVELLAASRPDPRAADAVGALDVNANELALVYRARGMDTAEANAKAERVLSDHAASLDPAEPGGYDGVGSPIMAAASSFIFFASGALLPILPWIFGLSGLPAMIAAALIVGLALLMTGGVVGVLSGSSPLARALRQLAIGYGAALATIILGRLFGANLS
ncbi:rubrerythrin family protein [Bowdeniella nasicola]|uniref:Rubrerythrin family protein n=1 Tax=Bowdeniella nasicola TaxID=208480 RepID=A0A1Q5Q580_9ACTO|nr:VIT1/CCC1 family protein [Bowdeniella nasicola]OKL54987.1 rubrerythrin family protein [Bowdeniella nasicola]